MPDFAVYILYVVAVAVVVVLSIKLGKYVDVIDAKSNISGAFIGGVMLAAVTSLPELFSSLSSVWIVKENSLVIGNILGSNLINLAFMGAFLIGFAKGFKKAKFNKYYYVGLIVCLAMFGLVALGLYLGKYLRLGWYSAVSPVILAIYVIYILKMPKTSEEGESSDDGITLKQAVVRFAVCAVILIGASIALAYLTDNVADMLGLGKTFAGALFLGVATSLPELVSSITLCSRGNFNAAAGNIIGSNVFNFTILFVADVLSFGALSNIYVLNDDSAYLLILGAIATVATLVMLIVKNRVKKCGIGALIGVETINAVSPALYVIFLLLSTGVLVL